MSVERCPFCSSEIRLVANDYVGYKEDLLFAIYNCTSCSVSFPSPQRDAGQLYDVIYENSKMVPGYDRYWGYFDRIKGEENPLGFLANSEETYWGVEKALELIKNDIEDPKILEIGSGLGYLTYALKKADFDVVGMDISSEAVLKANEHFGNYFIQADLYEYAIDRQMAYDVVVLTEVIEHIPEPINFIGTIFKLLKPNGKIILTTPNKSIAPVDIIWDTEAPPIHHWWFTEKSIKAISKKLAATVKLIDYSSYYKKKPKLYRANKARRNPNRKPIISSDNELLQISKQRKHAIVKHSHKRALKLQRLKHMYYKIAAKLNKDLILCDRTGITLCAILEKNKE